MKKTIDCAALGAVAQMIQKRMDDGHIPGASAAVWYRGNKVYETQMGYSDIEKKTPLQADAIFHMASMTKPITAVCLMQQVEAGKVKLTDEVRKFIPELTGFMVAEKNEKGEVVGHHPAPREITVLDCLTHSSGLGSGVGDDIFRKVQMKEGENLRDFVPRYAQIPLAFDPGSRQFYSPIAAPDVVACIVELVSGENYPDYVRNHLTGPLKMTDTAYILTPEQRARVVAAAAWDAENLKCVPAKIAPSEFFGSNTYGVSGGGCIYSTLGDYGRFARMLLGKGTLDGVRILSEESVRTMATGQLDPGVVDGVNDYFNWGLLVRVLPKHHPERQQLPAGTFGWSGAFGTHFIVCPELELCGVILTNTTTAGGAGAITAAEFERAIISTMRKAD